MLGGDGSTFVKNGLQANYHTSSQAQPRSLYMRDLASNLCYESVFMSRREVLGIGNLPVLNLGILSSFIYAIRCYESLSSRSGRIYGTKIGIPNPIPSVLEASKLLSALIAGT